MTCKECIHNAVCYLRIYRITSDYANKCGDYLSDNVIDDIKAEIKELPYQRIFGKVSSYSLLDTVLEIIDKHIERSE